MEKLREQAKKEGVEKLWAREVSSEVREAWEKAQLALALGEGEKELER